VPSCEGTIKSISFSKCIAYIECNLGPDDDELEIRKIQTSHQLAMMRLRNEKELLMARIEVEKLRR
jgi:hypothetical protein